jgi:hypothetical protein
LRDRAGVISFSNLNDGTGVGAIVGWLSRYMRIDPTDP